MDQAAINEGFRAKVRAQLRGLDTTEALARLQHWLNHIGKQMADIGLQPASTVPAQDGSKTDIFLSLSNQALVLLEIQIEIAARWRTEILGRRAPSGAGPLGGGRYFNHNRETLANSIIVAERARALLRGGKRGVRLLAEHSAKAAKQALDEARGVLVGPGVESLTPEEIEHAHGLAARAHALVLRTMEARKLDATLN